MRLSLYFAIYFAIFLLHSIATSTITTPSQNKITFEDRLKVYNVVYVLTGDAGETQFVTFVEKKSGNEEGKYYLCNFKPLCEGDSCFCIPISLNGGNAAESRATHGTEGRQCVTTKEGGRMDCVELTFRNESELVVSNKNDTTSYTLHREKSKKDSNTEFETLNTEQTRQKIHIFEENNTTETTKTDSERKTTDNSGFKEDKKIEPDTNPNDAINPDVIKMLKQKIDEKSSFETATNEKTTHATNERDENTNQIADTQTTQNDNQKVEENQPSLTKIAQNPKPTFQTPGTKPEHANEGNVKTVYKEEKKIEKIITVTEVTHNYNQKNNDNDNANLQASCLQNENTLQHSGGQAPVTVITLTGPQTTTNTVYMDDVKQDGDASTKSKEIYIYRDEEHRSNFFAPDILKTNVPSRDVEEMPRVVTDTRNDTTVDKNLPAANPAFNDIEKTRTDLATTAPTRPSTPTLADHNANQKEIELIVRRNNDTKYYIFRTDGRRQGADSVYYCPIDKSNVPGCLPVELRTERVVNREEAIERDIYVIKDGEIGMKVWEDAIIRPVELIFEKTPISQKDTTKHLISDKDTTKHLISDKDTTKHLISDKDTTKPPISEKDKISEKQSPPPTQKSLDEIELIITKNGVKTSYFLYDHLACKNNLSGDDQKNTPVHVKDDVLKSPGDGKTVPDASGKHSDGSGVEKNPEAQQPPAQDEKPTKTGCWPFSKKKQTGEEKAKAKAEKEALNAKKKEEKEKNKNKNKKNKNAGEKKNPAVQKSAAQKNGVKK